jgi:hypothetical protein
MRDYRSDLIFNSIYSIYLTPDLDRRLQLISSDILSAVYYEIPIVTIPTYKIDDSILDTQTLTPARIATEVSKIYTNDFKYNGTDSLDRKLEIFMDIYKKIGLSSEEIMRVFPIIFKKFVLD